MAGISIIGNGGTVAEVDATARAAHVRTSPVEVGSLGSYRATFATGAMAAGLAAAAPIFAFRWSDATRICVLRELRFGLQAATAFTAGSGLVEALVARSFTVQDTGGTAVTPTGNNQKNRTSPFGTTLAAMQMSATAALTAGTRTLDTLPFAVLNFSVNATATSAQVQGNTEFYKPVTADGTWPIVFAQNEGFIVRLTVPATGTHTDYITVAWDEAAAYP